MSANDRQVGGSHYKVDGVTQHWDFTWEHKYNQFEYCVSKYVSRYKHKNGLEDLEKAMHHLEKYIEKVGDTHNPAMEREVDPAALWCDDHQLDQGQKAVILFTHIGALYSAKKSLTKYIEAYKETTEEIPREYVNPDL